MPKHTSAAEPNPTPIRVVIVTMDGHLASAVDSARRSLRKELTGLTLGLHCASEWADDPEARDRCLHDIAHGDVILVTMLFMEEHIQPVLEALRRRREHCDALVACMCAAEVTRLTRMGGFQLDGPQKGLLARLKKLRGKSRSQGGTAGARQMAMLRQLPKILRFIPGTAQDARAYFLTLQYWLAGSTENVTNMLRYLINRYASGDRKALRGNVKAAPPIEYPDIGLYHPALTPNITDKASRLPVLPGHGRGRVGLLVMRAYVLGGNTRHYDAVIEAMERRGLEVIPAFASGLDAREAIDKYFVDHGRVTVDALVSLTGFSLVGGPAYNDAHAAEDTLVKLDVPYFAALATEFQTLEDWARSDQGLQPIETTMMVAIPELDGATGSILFGGRSTGHAADRSRDMQPHEERIETLAARVEHAIRLRRKPRSERRLAAVLFNFPPNAGATGTAAFLDVMASLHRTMTALAAEGYEVEVPESVDALRSRILQGNAAYFGTPANVHTKISVDDHVRGERWLEEIEAQWGPAPGRELTDGRSLFVLGAQFGKLFVGIQPGFGYEGDPMRLLFEKGFAPTHAFSAFYRYLREDYDADAVLHFGTHGALEFMPGKQAGLAETCWPDRLIGDLPNLYLYAANNPSEGTIAKRRSAATLISYLTPPMSHAGLYRGLVDLKASVDRWRTLPSQTDAEAERLAELIQAQAAELDLAPAEPPWNGDAIARIAELVRELKEVEESLIPEGLHIVGKAMAPEERREMLAALGEATTGRRLSGETLERLLNGAGASHPDDDRELMETLARVNALLATDHEIPALIHALDGGFVRPVPGGDLLRNPEILPTGRNVHGFDPFRLPSPFAVKDGARQAQRLLDRHLELGNPLPESIAMVLWGTDNLKSEGGPIAQALALIGARPRFDSYGRLAGAELIPLEELGRPRIDVVMTLSGIFRDLLPNQTRLLADAAYLAASADEPLAMNFVRKHALAHQASVGCDLETAALRVFSNAQGAYGSNVNMMVDNGRWDDEDELAETYTRRKCFAYGRDGAPSGRPELLRSVLAGVQLAYQNLESAEVGVTTIDHYFDTLGGISRAVQRARGETVEVYIGDQTRGDGTVRTLSDQVALETRTRMLNPKWHEAMLRHGYEGVRQIEAHVTNTLGWSATTGKVAPWVYKQITQTFMLDPEMRERMAALNPTASARVASRLLEAHERRYWTPDDDMLAALREAGEELEDRLEGVGEANAA